MIHDERVVKEFPHLREVGPSRMRVRVLEPGPGKALVLDVREYVESAKFTGWTKRGIRLDPDAFSTLVEQAPAILDVLASTRPVRGAAGGRPKR